MSVYGNCSINGEGRKSACKHCRYKICLEKVKSRFYSSAPINKLCLQALQIQIFTVKVFLLSFLH